mmetsp:Transcript_12673/g.26438  ORF Transcript_12673/g.26438 Transcript_12673/m.26438 type:complete len:160 (+) Transcript_12673:424-903(+)
MKMHSAQSKGFEIAMILNLSDNIIFGAPLGESDIAKLMIDHRKAPAKTLIITMQTPSRDTIPVLMPKPCTTPPTTSTTTAQTRRDSTDSNLNSIVNAKVKNMPVEESMVRNDMLMYVRDKLAKPRSNPSHIPLNMNKPNWRQVKAVPSNAVELLERPIL